MTEWGWKDKCGFEEGKGTGGWVDGSRLGARQRSQENMANLPGRNANRAAHNDCP